MRQTDINFDVDIMNLSRQYGAINLQLIFAQRVLDSKLYFGNTDDVLEILGHISLSKINT